MRLICHPLDSIAHRMMPFTDNTPRRSMNGRQDQQEQQELQEKVKEIVLQVGHKGQDQDQGESATHGGPTIRNYTHKPT